MSDEKQRREAIEHLAGLIADIPVAMLTTYGPDHTLHSRLMVNVNISFQGELWFFTHADDPKVEEILGNPQVNAAFSAPQQQKYVSVSGTAALVRDKNRCELLWSEQCQPWFPGGLEDEELALIQVDVARAECWDTRKNAMVAIAGFIQGLAGKPHAAPLKHEKLDWETHEGVPGEKSPS